MEDRITKVINCDDGNKLYDFSNKVVRKYLDHADRVRLALSTLAEYENAEEQGLLLRLPCKVGDTVYVVKDSESQKCKVKSIIIEEDKVTYWYSQEKYFGEWKFTNESIGKTIFLTREEAVDMMVKMIESGEE